MFTSNTMTPRCRSLCCWLVLGFEPSAKRRGSSLGEQRPWKVFSTFKNSTRASGRIQVDSYVEKCRQEERRFLKSCSSRPLCGQVWTGRKTISQIVLKSTIMRTSVDRKKDDFSDSAQADRYAYHCRQEETRFFRSYSSRPLCVQV